MEGYHRVKEYFRRDGTRVRAHYRRNPSRSSNNSLPFGVVVAAAVIIALVGWRLSSGENEVDQEAKAWEIQGTTFTQEASDTDKSCGIHSFGDVQRFFLEHPCQELHRVLLATQDTDGNETVIAISKTVMPTAEQAEELKELVDRNGTGNIKDLAKQKLKYLGVEFTGQHYASKLAGSSVLIAEAEVASGDVDSATLKRTAQQALAYPHL